MKLNQLLEDSDILSEGIRLTEVKSYKLWENAGRSLKEAALTPDQIQKLFQQIEQGATAAGGNRTLLGKGKDAASAVNTAWEDLKTKIQNSKPIQNVDAAYDTAVAKIEAGLGGPDNAVNQVIQKYRTFAKEHPIAQSFIYAALIAAAGISGAGLGGAAVLGLLKMTDKLLQGEKFSSAAYQGGKTGAMAYAAGQIGKAIRGDQTPASGATDAAATQIKGSRGLASEAERIFREKVANGEITDYNSYQQGMTDSLDQALQNAGGKISGQSQETARMILGARLDSVAAQANGGEFSGSGPEKVAAIVKQLGGQVDADKIAQQTSAAAQLAQGNAASAAKAAGKAASDSASSAASGFDINSPGFKLPNDIVASNQNLDVANAQAWLNADNAERIDIQQTTGLSPTKLQSIANTNNLQPGTSPNDAADAAMKLTPKTVPDVTGAPKGAAMNPDYLNKVISGEHPRPMISAADAQKALDWQSQNGGQLQQATDAAAGAAKGYSKDYLEKVIRGEHPRPMISKEKAQALLNQMSATVKEEQVRRLFRILDNLPVNEGIWDTVKGAAGSALGAVANKAATVGKNLTTKITADKLMSAWKSAGSPTDSDELKIFLQKQGVDATIIDPAMKAVGISNAPSAPAASAPTAGKVGVPAGKAAVDQAVTAIKSVRGDRRQQVVQYAQTQFSGIKEEKFRSKFLGIDI